MQNEPETLLRITPYDVQVERWKALQAVARERKISFFSALDDASLVPAHVSLQDLTVFCDTLEAVLHAPRGR